MRAILTLDSIFLALPLQSAAIKGRFLGWLTTPGGCERWTNIRQYHSDDVWKYEDTALENNADPPPSITAVMPFYFVKQEEYLGQNT